MDEVAAHTGDVCRGGGLDGVASLFVTTRNAPRWSASHFSRVTRPRSAVRET